MQKKLKSNLARIRKINENYKNPGKSAKIVNNPAQERFTLNKILYSIFQLTRWPNKHVLQKNSVDDLLECIINLKIKADVDLKNYMMEDSKNWEGLKTIFEHFLKEHNAISMNNGYGRILESHMKKLKGTLNHYYFIFVNCDLSPKETYLRT